MWKRLWDCLPRESVKTPAMPKQGIDDAHTRREARQIAGMLLWSFLPGFVARTMPESWQTVLFSNALAQDNRDTVGKCRAAAAKTKRPARARSGCGINCYTGRADGKMGRLSVSRPLVALHGAGGLVRTTHRKPIWLVALSIICAWRAAGR